MDCLNQIVGIKSTTTVVGPPTDYDESTSGLFLLDFTKLQLKREACETLTFLEQAESAIADALLMTSEALSVALGEDYQKRAKVFGGLIGYARNTKELDLADWVGMKFWSGGKKGQFLKLTRIGIFSTSVGTFSVRVYKNRVLLETITDVPGDGTYLTVDKTYPRSEEHTSELQSH